MHWRFSCKFVTAYLGLLSIRFITGCAIHAAVLFWSCPAQCECPVWSQQAQSLPASISESHQQVFQSPRLKAEDLCHSSASLTGFQYRPGCFRGNLILSSLQNPYMLLSKKQRNKKKHTSGAMVGWLDTWSLGHHSEKSDILRDKQNYTLVTTEWCLIQKTF